MATKKTVSKSSKQKTSAKKAAAKKPAAKKAAAPKAPKAPKAEQKALPRHPRARVTANHESKAALAKSLASALVRKDEDESSVVDKLSTASNQQLLRLHGVVSTVKEKYGDRAKLIAKLGELEKKATDKDYLAKLETLGLPQLLDMARAHGKHA